MKRTVSLLALMLLGGTMQADIFDIYPHRSTIRNIPVEVFMMGSGDADGVGISQIMLQDHPAHQCLLPRLVREFRHKQPIASGRIDHYLEIYSSPDDKQMQVALTDLSIHEWNIITGEQHKIVDAPEGPSLFKGSHWGIVPSRYREEQPGNVWFSVNGRYVCRFYEARETLWQPQTTYCDDYIDLVSGEKRQYTNLTFHDLPRELFPYHNLSVVFCGNPDDPMFGKLELIEHANRNHITRQVFDHTLIEDIEVYFYDSASVSLDGKYVATSDLPRNKNRMEARIIIWSVETGQPVKEFRWLLPNPGKDVCNTGWNIGFSQTNKYCYVSTRHPNSAGEYVTQIWKIDDNDFTQARLNQKQTLFLFLLHDYFKGTLATAPADLLNGVSFEKIAAHFPQIRVDELREILHTFTPEVQEKIISHYQINDHQFDYHVPVRWSWGKKLAVAAGIAAGAVAGSAALWYWLKKA